MASHSLTAVASVVSVVKEKTIIALKINTRGCERVFYPMIVIVVSCLSLALLAVAAGTPAWVEVSCNPYCHRFLLSALDLACDCQSILHNLPYTAYLHSQFFSYIQKEP